MRLARLTRIRKEDGLGGLNVLLDGNCIHSAHEICDPYSEEEHAAIVESLDHLLIRTHDIASIATKTSSIVDKARSNLFAQLDIYPPLTKTRIRIDVCENMDRARTAQADTIHCIPWELLEDFCHWPILDPCVTVRRTVAPAVVGPEQERACSWPASTSINILLIVARDLGVGEGHESVIPSFALSAIQDVQKNLNTQQSTSPINLEMVRPGTCEALQEKLESTTREKG